MRIQGANGLTLYVCYLYTINLTREEISIILSYLSKKFNRYDERGQYPREHCQ